MARTKAEPNPKADAIKDVQKLYRKIEEYAEGLADNKLDVGPNGFKFVDAAIENLKQFRTQLKVTFGNSDTPAE